MHYLFIRDNLEMNWDITKGTPVEPLKMAITLQTMEMKLMKRSSCDKQKTSISVKYVLKGMPRDFQ